MNYERMWRQLKNEVHASYRARSRSSEIYLEEGHPTLSQEYQIRASSIASVIYQMSEIERQEEKKEEKSNGIH